MGPISKFFSKRTKDESKKSLEGQHNSKYSAAEPPRSHHPKNNSQDIHREVIVANHGSESKVAQLRDSATMLPIPTGPHQSMPDPGIIQNLVTGVKFASTTVDHIPSPSSNPPDPWSSQSLWIAACRELRKKDPMLVQTYEQASGFSLASEAQIEAFLKKSLTTHDEDREKWVLHLASLPVDVRKCGERLVKFGLWSRDLVSSALTAQPHMALAWAGVTLLLPLALNPSKETTEMIEGLDEITDLLRLYEIRTELCKDSATDGYRVAIIRLYRAILDFQLSTTLHLQDNAWARGFHSISREGQWSSRLAGVKQEDANCQKHEGLVDKKAEKTRWDRQDLEMQQSIEIQQQMLNALSTIVSSRAAERDDDHRREALEAFAADYDSYKNFNPPRVADTCLWFLGDQRFIDWRNDTEPTLLWLATGPGCGKSVLSRSLIDEGLLSPRVMTTTVCHFFFKDNTEGQNRVEDALCCILHQLYTRNLAPDLIRHAYEPMKDFGQKLPNMFDALWNLFVETAKDPTAGEIVCLIDGLDECPKPARRKLLDKLSGYYHPSRRGNPATSSLKFFIVSRPIAEFDDFFARSSQTAGAIQFNGDEQTDIISKEINKVIDKRIPDVVRGLDEDSQILLANHLKSIKQRTYLWLYLVMEEIKENLPIHDEIESIQEFIHNLPDSVNRAYEKIMQQILDKDITRTILKVILAARRPLTTTELSVAEAVVRRKYPRSHKDLRLTNKQEQHVANLRLITGFFIEIHDSRVYLIHQTAREFLLQSAAEIEVPINPASWKHSIKIEDAEYLMAQICINIVRFDFPESDLSWMFPLDDFGKSEKFTKYDSFSSKDYEAFRAKYNFLDYACEFWPSHCSASQQLGNDAELIAVSELLDYALKYYQIWTPRWEPYNHKYRASFRTSPLILASRFGLIRFAKRLLSAPGYECRFNDIRMPGKAGLDATADSRRSQELVQALAEASENGHSELVQLLLDQGTDINALDSINRTFLQLAAERGHLDVVTKLLDKGAKIRGMWGDGAPLSGAAAGGYLDVVTELLERGATVNALSDAGDTALCRASKAGHFAVVTKLLEKNARVDDGGRNSTPLNTAVQENHLAIVALLLEKKAKINTISQRTGTALLSACSCNNLESVALLLDHGANPDLLVYNQSALHHATGSNKLALMKILLDKGANPDLQSHLFGTPLHVAAVKGHNSAATLLLKKGAKVNARDSNKNTALESALLNEHYDTAWVLLQHKADSELLPETVREREAVAKLLREFEEEQQFSNADKEKTKQEPEAVEPEEATGTVPRDHTSTKEKELQS